jgi:hypothetical protein
MDDIGRLTSLGLLPVVNDYLEAAHGFAHVGRRHHQSSKPVLIFRWAPDQNCRYFRQTWTSYAKV